MVKYWNDSGMREIVAGCIWCFMSDTHGIVEEENKKRYTMKCIPKEERPYEKCLAGGAACLSDAELLAVILRTVPEGNRHWSCQERFCLFREVKRDFLAFIICRFLI